MTTLLQAFPTERALAEALRKQKPLMANKKRLSRLKRIILREREDKALVEARDAAARGASALEAAQAHRESIQEQLKVCTRGSMRLPHHSLRSAKGEATWQSPADSLLTEVTKAAARRSSDVNAARACCEDILEPGLRELKPSSCCSPFIRSMHTDKWDLRHCPAF